MPRATATRWLLLSTLALGACGESYETIRAIRGESGEDCPTVRQARKHLVGVVDCDECCNTVRVLGVLDFEERGQIQTVDGTAEECRYRVRERPANQQRCGLLCTCI